MMQQQKQWGTARTRAGALVLPCILFVELVALGANGPLLAVAAATLEIAGALLVLILLAPNAAFWGRAWPPVLLVVAAMLWLVLPGRVEMGISAPPRLAPDMLLPGLVRILGGFAVLLAGAWIGYRRGLMHVAAQALAAFGLLDIAIGFALRFHDPAAVWGIDKGILRDRFTGTLLNANSSGCLFGVISLLALGRLLARLGDGWPGRTAGEKGWTLCNGVCLICALAACATTGSRTAMLLTLTAHFLILATDTALRRFLFTRPGLITFAVAGVVTATLAMTLGDLTLTRFAALGSDGGERYALWQHYYALAARSPWTGYGPLSFEALNLATMQTPADSTAYWYINSPHNILLSILITGGWPYLILLAAAGTAMLAGLARSSRGRRDPTFVAVLASVVLLITCAMVDIELDVPALAALLIALVALAWGRAVRAAVDSTPRKAGY